MGKKTRVNVEPYDKPEKYLKNQSLLYGIIYDKDLDKLDTPHKHGKTQNQL